MLVLNDQNNLEVSKESNWMKVIAEYLKKVLISTG